MLVWLRRKCSLIVGQLQLVYIISIDFILLRSELMVAPFVAVLVLSCIILLVGVSLLIVGVRRKRRHAGVEAPIYKA